ncbi:MAG: hypothetical protein V1866_00340 [archaeon]
MAKHTEKEKKSASGQEHRTLLSRPLLLFLSFIIFCALFLAIFYTGKSSAIKGYNAANNDVLSIRSFGGGEKILDLFTKFGALFGLGLGVIMLISLFIWYSIAKLFRLTKHRVTVPIILLIVYGFWFLIGLKLAFFENGYTTWANGIIYFAARQLFYATLIMIIGAAALLFLPSKKRGGKDE